MMDCDKAIKIISERIYDRIKNDRQSQNQRRNQVVDLFGVEFSGQGDSTHPATMYVSISPDLGYLERFEFKIAVSPFAMPIVGNGATGNATVQVNGTSLASNGTTITPNPHNHTTQGHNHSLDPGVSLFASSFSDFEIWVEDINVTPYLKAQWPDGWPDKEDIFPNKDVSNNFDILKIVGYLPDWQQGVLTSPGVKKFELKAKGIFNAKLITYLKFSHTNR